MWGVTSSLARRALDPAARQAVPCVGFSSKAGDVPGQTDVNAVGDGPEDDFELQGHWRAMEMRTLVTRRKPEGAPTRTAVPPSEEDFWLDAGAYNLNRGGDEGAVANPTKTTEEPGPAE